MLDDAQGTAVAVENEPDGESALAEAQRKLDESYPHLSPERKAALSKHLLGFVTWLADRDRRRARAAALLLVVPFVFYVHSMAHAAVPIYIPILPPFSYYNLRYGLEALPALAVFPSFLVGPTRQPTGGARRALTAAVVFALLLGEAAFMVRGGGQSVPVVQESIRNTPCKAKRQQAVIEFFRREYNGKEILMTPGEWLCLNPSLGIPFRKTLSETDGKSWIKLSSGIPRTRIGASMMFSSAVRCGKRLKL